MTTQSGPLQEIFRVRRTDDLVYVRSALTDEVVINANQLENSVASTSSALLNSDLPFTVDPVLWRFQLPSWWRNSKGNTKRNYRRLAAAYTRDTQLEMAAGPLLGIVSDDKTWDALALNVIRYEETRLLDVPTQLDLFGTELPRELRPARLIAPALVALTSAEDRVNERLVLASVAATDDPLAAQVVIPLARLLATEEFERILRRVPTRGVSSYLLWTPEVSEDLFLTDPVVFGGVLRLVGTLADRGLPVAHQYSSYAFCALHDAGLDAVTYHAGWVDHGEPADEPGFMIRSCRSYVPGARHSMTFKQAESLGRPLDAAAYIRDYCECTFCVGSFDVGSHPLDLLLEAQTVEVNGHARLTPTERAVAANTWHYLLSRRLEVQSFAAESSAVVVRRDVDRAARLADAVSLQRLRYLADNLQSA
jgi:hypothetical protein